MLKAYHYKLEPNRAQRYALARPLDVCRELYNDALRQQRWHRTTRFQQDKELTALKAAFPLNKDILDLYGSTMDVGEPPKEVQPSLRDQPVQAG